MSKPLVDQYGTIAAEWKRIAREEGTMDSGLRMDSPEGQHSTTIHAGRLDYQYTWWFYPDPPLEEMEGYSMSLS